MYIKKGICLFLLATAVLTLPLALNQHQQKNSDKVRADGGAPVPPAPKKLLRAGQQLNTDSAVSTPVVNHLTQV
jgi:hypothetical protein